MAIRPDKILFIATSLQPAEWGVDVVETASADSFLSALNWNERVKDKPIDRVFKIEIKGK